MTENSDNNENVVEKGYKAPRLTSYGTVTQMTGAITGNSGFDGAPTPSSYTTS